MARTCRADECKAVVAPGFLMCPHHWKLVSRHTQREVYRTYKTWQKHMEPMSAADYRKTAELAIAEVRIEEGRASGAPEALQAAAPPLRLTQAVLRGELGKDD